MEKTESILNTASAGTLGIYIHVPFCMSKCPYCDFYSEVLGIRGDSARTDAFTDALITEIELRREEISAYPAADTVYFGGGTPSMLTPGQISRIMAKLRGVCGERLTADAEVTMELNPFGASEGRSLKGYADAGINRLSIGAQSFDDAVLKKLGRLHRSGDISATVKAAREAGFKNISLDLMFGIEGQSEESWLETVKSAAALMPEHISLYSLEFMEGTKFTKWRDEGRLRETDPEADRKMYHSAIDLLKKQGYVQYEISNMSLGKEYRSRHNSKYWNLEDYEGFGPSAHSLTGGKRYENPNDAEAYAAAYGAECSCKEGSCTHGHHKEYMRRCYEILTEDDCMSEYCFTKLRTAEGINYGEFRRRFGCGVFDAFPDAKEELAGFEAGGFVEIGDEKNEKMFLRLTEKGFDISNKILCSFV